MKDRLGSYQGFMGFVWREEVVDISSTDFVYDDGFLCEGVMDGTLRFVVLMRAQTATRFLRLPTGALNRTGCLIF